MISNLPEPLTFELLPWEQIDWVDLEGYGDRTLFQSRSWLEFVRATQKAEPAVAALKQGGQTVGYFSFLTTRRFGLRIVGSPLTGWTTAYMGFNVRDESVREEALKGVRSFLFESVGCAHFELMDRQVAPSRAESLGFACRSFCTYEIDLRLSENELMARMHPSARRYVARAERRKNVQIEECSDGNFARDYYAQLVGVFAKQELAPTYGVDRVEALIRALNKSGEILLLRARDTSGDCLATGIFPARNGMMYFWGGASRQSGLTEHPNEPLHWYAMHYWKRRGVFCYDMGGGGEYKEKYGGVKKERAWICASRNGLIAHLRGGAYRLFRLKQRVRGWSRRARTRTELAKSSMVLGALEVSRSLGV